MYFRQVKIGELDDFIKNGGYRSYNILPITPERAESQALNPDADDDDTALVIALNETNEIVGYIGIMPGLIKPDSPEKIYWNSCWWTDPKKGSGSAMALFFQMLKLTGRKMIFAELSDATAVILRNLPGFILRPPVEGLTGYIKPDIEGFLKRRKIKNFITRSMGSVTGHFSSLLRQPAISLWRRKLERENLTHHVEMEEMDEEADVYIKKHQDQQLTIKTARHFNWIKKFPWLVDDAGKEEKKLAEKYYFSWIVSGWTTRFYKIYAENVLVAVLILTNREGNCKLPYIYYNREYTRFIAEEIYRILFEQKAKSISLFHEDIINHMMEFPNPFLYTRKIKKQMAWTEETCLAEEDVILQDGDGDAVFT